MMKFFSFFLFHRLALWIFYDDFWVLWFRGILIWKDPFNFSCMYNGNSAIHFVDFFNFRSSTRTKHCVCDNFLSKDLQKGSSAQYCVWYLSGIIREIHVQKWCFFKKVVIIRGKKFGESRLIALKQQHYLYFYETIK